MTIRHTPLHLFEKRFEVVNFGHQSPLFHRCVSHILDMKACLGESVDELEDPGN
jgi:hypothetical protein